MQTSCISMGMERQEYFSHPRGEEATEVGLGGPTIKSSKVMGAAVLTLAMLRKEVKRKKTGKP